MRGLQAFIVILTVTYCYGAGGGGGHGGSKSASVKGSEDVKVLKVPKTITLICNLTASEINWYKEDTLLEADDHVLISGTNLTLLKETTIEDVGTYKCQSSSDSSLYRIYDVVTMSYKSLPKSTTALEGDQFSLTCDADGLPMPTITWTKDGHPLDEIITNGSKVEYRDGEKGLINATIVLTDITQADRGEYTCTISNHPSLVYNTTSNVRIKDIYAALWPFLGIVAEVVILCLVIFIYEKHRSKNDFEESDTDTNARSRT